MALPPNDIPKGELFRRLSETPRPSEVVDFPRRDPESGKPICQVRLTVLNGGEYDQARFKAEQWVKKKLGGGEQIGEISRQVMGDRVAKEILAMATVTVNPLEGSDNTDEGPRYGRMFITADEVDALTSDELTVLWMAQQAVQNKYGPYEGNLETEEQVTAWMRALTEGASAIPLVQLSWHQLVELTSWLADRAYCLSAILHSQHSNLPASLSAALTNLDIGTISFTALPATATRIGLSRQELGLQDLPMTSGATQAPELPRMLPNDPIDIKTAARILEDLYKSGKI